MKRDTDQDFDYFAFAADNARRQFGCGTLNDFATLFLPRSIPYCREKLVMSRSG